VALFLVVLVVGELAMLSENDWAASPVFILGAALPPLIALAFAVRRLESRIGWRTLLPAMLTGALASVWIAIALEVALPAILFAVVMPFREIVGDVLRADSLEELFYSPALVAAFIEMAVVAPIAEEFAKPLAVLVLMSRLADRKHAALVGMAGGAGFAIVENMFYEGIWFDGWLEVTAARGIGGALHPLGAGLVGLALFDAWKGRAGGRRGLVGAYGAAVLLHMAWNGGLVMLYSTLGEGLTSGAGGFSLLGVRDDAAVVAYLVALDVLIWRLLFLFTQHLRDEAPATGGAVPALGLADPRRLSAFAVVALVVALGSGAAWGPTIVRQVQQALL
jgi:RsiW-degrading membrane proteinase PrsW (M82 family)